MAARTRRIAIDANTRAKIQTSLLQKRLTDHALGLLELSPTQVRAIEILLKKTLPDLQSIEQTTEITERKVISSAPMKIEEWEAAQKKAANE